MAKYNPKLKKVFFVGDDGSTPSETTFSDEGIFEFMSKVKLEEACFLHSSSISGELFGNIGKCAPELQVLRVQRVEYNGDLVPEHDDVVFGGGIMYNLTELNISGSWENLNENFVDSIITYMPNIKKIYLSDEVRLRALLHVKLINHYDLETLSVRLYETLTSEVNDQILQAIGSKKNLQKLYFYPPYSDRYELDNLVSIERLKNIFWPHMTSIAVPLQLTREWLIALERACPNLKKLEFLFEYGRNYVEYKESMLEFLKDKTHWPKLKRFDCEFSKELNLIRPFVYGEGRSRYYDIKEESTPEGFVRDWLYSDFTYKS